MLVQHFLEHSAARTPSKVALVHPAGRLCYAELDARADRLSNALLRAGLQGEDRVAIGLDGGLDDGAHAVVALFAALKAGGVFVVLPPATPPAKLRGILSDAGARFLLTDARGAQRHATAPAPSVERVVVVDEPADHSGGSTLAEFLADAPPARAACARHERDLASLIYTSGSSGEPKGVMLTHKNIVSASGSILQYLRGTADDVVLDVLPLSFDYGLYNVLMPVRCGGTAVIAPARALPLDLPRLVAREGVNAIALVPPLIAILLQFAHALAPMPRVRRVTTTGQALPPAHIAPLQRLFPAAEIFSMYGLTECKRVSYLPPSELARRPTSVGIAIPGTSVSLIGDDGRTIDTPGVAGELCVRGPHVMLGYWRRPEASARVVSSTETPDVRVLRTGDLFRRDAEGFLYFLGRRDHMIKTAGGAVSPREVEAVLCTLAGVREAAVCAAPHPILGDVVFAALVPSAAAHADALTPVAVRAHCAPQLGEHAIPTFTRVYDDLPRTASGKVDYGALRHDAARIAAVTTSGDASASARSA